MTGQFVPLAYLGDSGQGYVVIEGHGRFSLDDWASVLATQLADNCWHAPLLFDLSDPTSTFPLVESAGAITRSLQEVTHERGPRGPLAIVIGNDAFYPEVRGYVQMFGPFLPHPLEVFRQRADAVAWLTNTQRTGRSIRDDR